MTRWVGSGTGARKTITKGIAIKSGHSTIALVGTRAVENSKVKVRSLDVMYYQMSEDQNYLTGIYLGQGQPLFISKLYLRFEVEPPKFDESRVYQSHKIRDFKSGNFDISETKDWIERIDGIRTFLDTVAIESDIRSLDLKV